MIDAHDSASLVPAPATWLPRQARERADHPALVLRTDRAEKRAVWSYRELLARALSARAALAALGVRAGDRVGVIARSPTVTAVTLHASLLGGTVLVPLFPRLGVEELAWQIDRAGCRVVVVDTEAATAVPPECATWTCDLNVSSADDDDAGDIDAIGAAPVPASDAALLVYTSGSTARPKGVLLSASALWHNAHASAKNLGTHADDRWLCCLPLAHVGGLSILTRCLVDGTTAVLEAELEAATMVAALRETASTLVSLVPTMLARLLDAGEEPPAALRAVLLGGGRVDRTLVERALAAGWPVVPTYGLTEAASQVATMPAALVPARPECAGRALDGTELRIVAPSAVGVGEIVVRGPTVMLGYHRDEAATRAAIRDGWLHTGDHGRLDADGLLEVVGRRQDLVVTGGENVSPAAVEAVLTAHADVREACVVGVADREWGEVVAAAVALREGASEVPIEELDSWCADRLSAHQRPRRIAIVPALPRRETVKGESVDRAAVVRLIDAPPP